VTAEQCLLRGDSWIFGPEAPYEREGDVGYVAFPCGYTLGDDGDAINLYYGARTPASRWRPAASRNSSIGWIGMAQRLSPTARHMTDTPSPLRGSLPPFDVRAFLDSAGISRRIVRYARASVVFAQGGPANSVFYIQHGGVKLSVLSRRGREAIVAMLAPGDFFGEGCLAGQPFRIGTATALVPTTVLRIQKRAMMPTLHEQSALSDRFIAHMLARNIRIEEDLVDQLFDSARNGWREPCSSSHATAMSARHNACCRRSRRKRSPRWSVPAGRA
jgi:CRP-like cAMP-binding protein